MKYAWKVQPPLTGRFRSFEQRGWPEAWYETGDIAAAVFCGTEDYSPAKARDGGHGPLAVRVADHSAASFIWRRLKGEFATLDEAKKAVASCLAAHPEFAPLDPAEAALEEEIRAAIDRLNGLMVEADAAGRQPTGALGSDRRFAVQLRHPYAWTDGTVVREELA